MSTFGPTNDHAHQITSLVGRLQALHAELAGQPAALRRQRLAAQVEHDISGLPSPQRAGALAAFSTLLQDLQASLHAVAGAGPAAQGSLGEVTDPVALAGRLAALASTLSPAQRAVVQRQLREAGLSAEASSTSPAQSPAAAKQLAANLQLPSPADLDPGRVLELAGMLIDFAASLDQLVWNTWKAVSPDSAVKRTAPLKSSFGRFAARADETSTVTVKHDLERLRQVTAALTAAVGQAGRQFAQRHQQKFAPAEIERLARDEGNWNLELRCWKKYQQLAAANDVEAMQLELMAAVAAYAEALLRGATAVPAR